MKHFRIFALILNSLALAALLTIAPVQTASARFITTHGDGFTQVDGSVFGAPFRLVRPDDWNRNLVLLLHGSVPADAPIQMLPVGHGLFQPMIDKLLARGFGVALSSYRVNGYAVREGTIDSQIAQLLFNIYFGRPSATYLAGFSMGVHIGQRLVETGPKRYDGFLAVCGGPGGSTVQTEYAWNVRILFDYFYPDVLPGNVLTPELDFETEVVPAAFAALTANPGPAFELAGVDQLGIRWTTPEELFNGVISSLFGGTGEYDHFLRGKNPIDNTATMYSGSSDDAALNAGVGRFAADRRAARKLRRWYDPTGLLRGTPILHLHTTRDPIVPLQLHQPVFEELLATTGNQHLYVVRAIDRFGHCNLNIPEFLTSVDDLVLWAESGVAPAP